MGLPFEGQAHDACGEVTAIADEAGRQGQLTGLRLPLDEEDNEPWAIPPSRRRPEAPIIGPLPERIDAVLADQIYIPREGLPAGLVNRIIRLAAFQNPAFYRVRKPCGLHSAPS